MEEKYHIKNHAYKKGIQAAYDAINQECFGGELPKIPIRVNKLDSNKDYEMAAAFVIHIEPRSFVSNNKRYFYRIEFISITFNSTMTYFSDTDNLTDDLLDFLFHEMIHEYCYLYGIENVTGEQYHNYNFAEVAENHGLICLGWDKRFGFNRTIIPPDLFNRIIARIPSEIWEYMNNNITGRRKPHGKA